MYTITDLHIELTDRCQASCPMCARNYNGGAVRPFVAQRDVTLDVFKKWFDDLWLSKLQNFYACGNYGDPIIARDCLEIFQYVRQINPTARLSIHTNGSARSIEWWTALANTGVEVSFGIDGFKSSHVLYRRGTDWDKIIENMTAFIDAGGQAIVDCLIFKHNENEINEFDSYMKTLGVKKINFKYTSRFYNMDSFPVQDVDGYIEYRLEPSSIQVSKINIDEIIKDPTAWANGKNIKPKCVDNKEIYVDCRGNVFPCCWVGSDWVEEHITETTELQTLRNQLIDDTRKKFKDIGIINLNNHNIHDVQWRDLDNLWNKNVPWVCAKNCNG